MRNRQESAVARPEQLQPCVVLDNGADNVCVQCARVVLLQVQQAAWLAFRAVPAAMHQLAAAPVPIVQPASLRRCLVTAPATVRSSTAWFVNSGQIAARVLARVA